MSMKRLALIAAVGSHHTSRPTTTPTASFIAPPLPPTAIASAGGITDDTNLNLNAAGISRSGSAAGIVDGGASSESGGANREGGKSVANTRHGEINYFAEDIGGAGTGGGGGLYQGHQAMRPGATLHGNVNVLLGGAMLSVVITVVCVVCYCCHRSIKKRSESIYRQQHWTDNTAASMEVYSVEQCYEASRIYAESPERVIHFASADHSGPPPSYDSVLAIDEFIGRPSPPPKYHQPQVQCSNKCCTFARQASLPLHACCTNSNRKSNRPQRPSNHDEMVLRTHNSCSCLESQMGQPNQRSRITSNDSNLNKSVPTAIDSVNNNNINTTAATVNATFKAMKPVYGCHKCQLCGKLQRYPDASNLTDSTQLSLVSADVQNGNSIDTTLCSCHDSEISLNYENGNDVLVHLEDTKLQVDDMNNAIRETAAGSQSVGLKRCTNSNQENPRRQCRHEDHQHHNELGEPEQLEQEQHQHQPALNLSALDTFNENGIIRLDMSQIIDRTGLPTYEAAIKLESSGYV